MLRYVFHWLRILLFVCIAILVLFCILFAALQSKWAKSQIREKIVSFLKENGLDSAVEELEGKPPFLWTIRSIDLSSPQYGDLHLEGIRCRLAIFPLFRGKIAIDYLKIEKALYCTSPHFAVAETELKNLDSFHLPFPVAIRHLHIASALIEREKGVEPISFDASGHVEARKDLRQFHLFLQLSSIQGQSSYLSLLLEGNQRKDAIAIQIEGKDLPLDIPELHSALSAKLTLNGSWTSWREWLHRAPVSTTPLTGECIGACKEAQFPQLPLFNGNWKFRSLFETTDLKSLKIETLLLSSDLLHLKGKGILQAELDKSQLLLGYSFPKLSLISSILKGSAKGKAFYQKGEFKNSLTTKDLFIADHKIDCAQAIFKGNYSEEKWIASAQIESAEADIPFTNAFTLEWIPHHLLSLHNFRFHVEEGDVQANLHYDIAKKSLDGTLDASIDHLDRFGGLFREEYIEGSIGVYGQAWTDVDKQNIHLAFLGKNMRYRELLLDQLSFNASFSDLWKTPEGKFHLLASKFYSPKLNIDQITFGTTSDEEGWPFYLDVNGKLDHPFQCFAKGFGIKDHSLFSLELTELTGDLSGELFRLRYPSTLEWGTDFLNLSPFDFLIGKGKLYTRFELSPVRSLGKWDLSHFPLEVLSSIGPRMNFSGHITASGFLDAYPDSIQGALNAVIEKADFLHFGKNDPFKTKGSFQAHVDKNVVQLHTDLHAIDAQVLDFNATLPLTYTLYPLRLQLDTKKPAAAELIAEGKLEDLFDFVNLGMNHLTGLVSTRLFLSHTLETPSLHGKLQWQNGTYENYFTGISLRDIQAQLEAEDDTLRLLSLTARDEDEGSLSAEGKIALDPQAHFPYSFTAEQKNLHALGFDMIDCNLTGPLYFTGNLQSAAAEGNLLIDSAKIQLTEKLPYEIPSLPVTFIHRPPHLLSQRATAKPRFAFHIDLELTADNKVLVEGRGLNAELQGSVHLSGTNTNVAANGSLQLIKGEYQFSGKIFKLTEGEIIFLNKPTPNAYLNLNGTLALANATITATLSGPLTHPQLTFQSNPQMPTSSILALILFNKDISDISHPEAIQLANTLMSLSGGAGPDVLETIRKSIGVDRLNISSASADSDEIAVQIGKYLTRGVLITLSQSATSTQVIVEVELPQGFVFQAETQEEQEGKFSLKWTKSY